MDDIVTITAGLPVDDPWVITNVNANVQNLATAKFASLGADQSVTIQKQNAALSDSVDKLNLVNDELDTIKATASVSPVELTVSDAALNANFQVPSSWPIADQKTSLAKELINLTEKMNSLNIDYGGADAYYYANSTTAGLAIGPIVAMLGPTDSRISQLTAGSIYTIPAILPATNLIYKVAGSSVVIDATTVKPQAIPTTKWEIFQWENTPASFIAAVKLTDSLSDTTVLIPNTNPSTLPSNAVTMEVPVGDYDAVQYTFGGKTYYSSLPVEKISTTVSNLTVPKPTGSIFIDSTGKMYFTEGPSNYSVITEADLKKFVLHPTSDQINSWRSKYAEKQVLISQRASEQQLFLTELTQKYNYFLDAITNILRSLNNISNEIVNKY